MEVVELYDIEIFNHHKGPVFGSVNNFYGLGVFFDTYPNREEKHKVLNPQQQQ